MAFIQIIEFQTGRIDEFDALLDQWLTAVQGLADRHSVGAHQGPRPAQHLRADRGVPELREGSGELEPTETAVFAESLGKLCDAPPAFRNLDVTREEPM